MAVTLANRKRVSAGSATRVISDVTFSGSYVNGGSSEAVSADSLGLARVDSITIQPKGGYSFEYDYTTGYVKVMQSAPLVVYQQSSTVAGTEVHSRSGGSPNPKVEATNSTSSDMTVQTGPLVEVTTGTNLSTITTRLEATGY